MARALAGALKARRKAPSWLGSPVPAVEFLTVLRWRRAPLHTSDAVARALWAFPVVGLVIGLAIFGVERAGREFLPAPGVAVVVLIAWVVVTGGLHLDGLADAADGLFGGRTREQRLTIMHDVRTGTWGTITVSLALLSKFAFVLALPEGGRFGALLLAPVVGRGLVVGAMAAAPYARPDGFGRDLHRTARWAPALLAGAAVLGTAVFAFGPGAIIAALAAAVVTAAVVLYAQRRLGGLTGDVDGALIEVTEIATLLAISAALERDWLSAYVWDGG